MSYELSDKLILKSELMKYRRNLCESIGGLGKSCESCRAFVKEISRCSIGVVLKSLETKPNSLYWVKRDSGE